MAFGRRARPWLLSLALLPAVSGCAAFGPYALENSHGRYHESVKRVEDEAFLRNLVRLRYTENISTLDIAAITAQFTLDAGAEARPFSLAPNPSTHEVFRNFNRILPDATISGADRPTISLNPGDDPDNISRLLRRLTADNFAFFVESGGSSTLLTLLWFDAMNRVNNAPALRRSTLLEAEIQDYPNYRRIAELLDELTRSRVTQFVVEERTQPVGQPVEVDQLSPTDEREASKLGLEYTAGPTPGTRVLVRSRRVLLLKVNALAQNTPQLQEFCDRLNLLPGQAEYEVVVGESQPFPATYPPERRNQIVLDSRSTFQAISFLSNGVAVPPEHVEQGLARNTVLPDGRVFDWTEVTAGVFRVCSVKRHHRPDHAYVAVKHHGYWFYIDDRDHSSKMAFNLVFQLSRLDLAVSEARLARSRPLLTLPLGP